MRAKWSVGLGLLGVCGAATAQPAHELPMNDAVVVLNGEAGPPQVAAGRFGPGIDSLDLPGARTLKSQVRYACSAIPEGDYVIGVLVLQSFYLTFAEWLGGQVHLYVNDTRVVWGAHTEPQRPQNAGEQTAYQAELRTGEPVHLRPGDVIRVMWLPEGGALTVGPVRLYAPGPADPVVQMGPQDWGRPQTVWLHAWMEDAERVGETVRQPVLLANPGVLPRTLTLKAEAKGYLQEVLLSEEQELTLSPGERVTKTYEYPAGSGGRTRFSLVAAADGVFPDVRLSRFAVEDRMTGARPNTCLNGEWETCTVPGVDPGAAPPADAQWKKISVPSLQPNTDGHCAWYRKVFEAPPHVQGERIVLRCGQVLSESWFTLNGQAVGHELHGSQPFEIDLTPAFRPGRRNELLVAVRDWLSYSPKNLDRVARGEAPIYKDSMVDVAGYTAAANLGFGGSVWLEARPAVSVDDLFIVTSVRQRKLRVRYEVLNHTAAEQQVTLTAQVLDAGAVAKVLPAAQATIPAGQTRTVEIEAPWTDPKLWWPEDPHLYVLQTDLQPASGAADRHTERFGFRELWIHGINLVLNGTRTKIRSAWASGASGLYQASQHWQPDRRLGAIWDWQTECIYHRDHQLTRTHNMAGVEEACDIADETGLMIKLEADVSQVSFTFDQAFWKAVIEAELRVIDRYKNHAAVVMWSAGNENMWGWIYQGEAAKTLGNRWQIKAARAMREADLMARPIEWEADGDLMGGWEHHALHYPREISQHPDVPNGAWWGPLDGKTVVPYSMGPITLGEKPLTVGEAFWPAVLQHPHGETIILGDDAYLGGQQWARAWQESSQFFINGFRDVEFALIDVYLPLWVIPPQAVVLKQEDRQFVGGQKLHRDLNVHNDLKRAADLAVRWTFTMPGVSVSDRVPVHCEPAELKRVALSVPLPKPTAPTPARWQVELLEGDGVVHTESRDWMIHPPASIRVPERLRLSVYDPRNETVEMLERLQVPHQRLRDLKAPSGGALIIGKDALQLTPQGPWREALETFVTGGGKVLILEQSEAPDFLPTPLQVSKARKMTLAFARAPEHPVLKGLTDDDLRWWTPDQYVSESNYRKPVRGNWLPLVDAGTMDGLLEAPLLEEYHGQGSYLLCQMLLSEKAGVSPPATRLLQNLLDYLAAPEAFRQPGRTALVAAAESPLRKAVDRARLECSDQSADPSAVTPAAFDVAVVEAAALNAAATQSLRAFAEQGGKVLVQGAGPEQQAALRELTGLPVRFLPVGQESSDIQNHVLRRTNSGLLAGVSNHDLYWVSNAYLAEVRHEGCWWSTFPTNLPEAETIVRHYCQPVDDERDRTLELTRPCALLQVGVGQGQVILSQLRFGETVPEAEVTSDRLCGLLLTNLGCTLRDEGGAALARKRRLQQYAYTTIDLGPYANRGLTDDKASGLTGWTNQGENDVRALPTGRQSFGGVPFHISTPKAAAVLYSVSADNTALPKEITGIRVGARADALFFLHSMAWGAEKPFRYRVNYEDGTSQEIEITNGRQVIDWWDDPVRFADAMSDAGAFVAWTGDNPMRKGIVLVGYEWANPEPAKLVRDVDFLTNPDAGYGVVPVLAGLTAATMQTNEGVVTDVIGTHGCKVKLGTEEQELYYIGLAGCPADHAFYDQAVAAHRALVVGQKVTIVGDVVAQDEAGHRLAYVYLGKDIHDVRSLVSAKIIGDGLGALGNFGGNNRERMYLENLGFIAKQRKAGMWAE